MRIFSAIGALAAAMILTEPAAAQKGAFETTDRGVVARPSEPGAYSVRVEAVAPDILRVTAGPDDSFERAPSLMIVDQGAPPAFKARRRGDVVRLETDALKADISLKTGAVTFRDAKGKKILAERPARAFEPKKAQGENFFAVHQVFDSDPQEGFYGLGQHQNGQMNYNGEDVELAQHNISIAMPFVLSTGGYGILWDNNSITRFGDPRPYQPIDRALIVRDAAGEPGGLTGKYYKDDAVAVTLKENDPDYQFLPPDQFATGESVRGAWPDPFGETAPEKIVWTGSLEAKSAGVHKFRVYASEYVKVYVDGALVVDRWRQNWNPYYFNFELEMKPGAPKDIRIEWLPNDGYFRLLHLDPMPADERRALSLSSEVADVIDYYFIHGKDMDGIIAGYRRLTGKAVMLPRWAYGFWQSRQRYTTQDELLDVLREYRARAIPIDNIVLDWFYWPEDKWGSHDFDSSRFPNPEGMVDAVHDMNAQIMISVWPKFYPGTKNFDELNEKGYIYQRNLEMNTRDWVGPGYRSSFYDPYSAEARTIFWRQMRDKLDAVGFDAWWLDATEPDIHSNLSHEERALRMGPTAMGPGAEYFNSYALPNAQGVYEGERAGAEPDRRVFILTRSGFPGLQRYGAAAWSGDVAARWDDLREQIAAGVNFSMSGVPNWTFDIGGFSVETRYSSEDQNHLEEWRELNLRWFQFGAFAPLFRSHGEYPYREIFNIAPESSEVYDSLVWHDRLRYRLLPYIYTLAGDAFHKDGTIMRGLVMDFVDDRKVWDINDQYMFGPAFLVSPVYEFGARMRRLYLPAGAAWYDFHTGERYDGGAWIDAAAPLARMPLFVRAGSIVPMGPDVQYASEKPDGDITLHVYTGADGAFALYEDDGLTYAYERGAWSRIPIAYDDARGVLTIGAREGAYEGMPRARAFHVKWISPEGGDGFSFDAAPDVSVRYAGETVIIRRN
ncbi:MAG: glycoside hydrolase family 31 protein [Amphiplicatus sp.]